MDEDANLGVLHIGGDVWVGVSGTVSTDEAMRRGRGSRGQQRGRKAERGMKKAGFV